MQEINLLSFLAVLSFQIAGAFFHWLKMKRVDRVMGTFVDYLIADAPGRSVATGAALFAAAWVSATSGAADNINPEVLWGLLASMKLHVASINGILAAITSGYFFDSVLNSDGVNK